jgi:hypothetical protein
MSRGFFRSQLRVVTGGKLWHGRERVFSAAQGLRDLFRATTGRTSRTILTARCRASHFGTKRILPSVLATVLAGCGSSAVSPTPSPSPSGPIVTDDFPVNTSGPHYHPINHASFGPWYGSGCPAFGDCACGGATDLAQESSCQLTKLAANDIPVSVYLFDGYAWSQTVSVGPCTGPDCCAWKLGDALIQQIQTQGVRALLHVWGGCHAPPQYQRAHDTLGNNLLGFYLDDGVDDSELQSVTTSMQSLIPGDWDIIAKLYQNGEPSMTPGAIETWSDAGYVGDLDFDFAGLKEAVARVLSKATLIPAPFAEFTGYAYLNPGAPTEEVFRRRLHFGAMQPVMAHTPYANADPWSPQYSPALLASYRYWTWLHRELVPYFYSYAYRMFENQNAPVLQAGPSPDSILVGDELYVRVVTKSTTTLNIDLPPGQWIDYWDESQVLSGSVAAFPVPLGKEPIFIRQGSLIPLNVERNYTGHGTKESAGSLTVLVYPNGASSFNYRPDATEPWIALTSTLSGNELTLTASPSPVQPVLYRIERWPGAPGSVAVGPGGSVMVNQGGSLPDVGDEATVNGSTQSAWFYDPQSLRLIVKVVP